MEALVTEAEVVSVVAAEVALVVEAALQGLTPQLIQVPLELISP
jgi:hypothetical protein